MIGTKPHFVRVSALILLFVVTPLCACLWDYDTLHMERQNFPGTLELITGKFLRHSTDYYNWRIEDRTRRLKDSPDDPDLVDDLAVALDKTGRHEDAIQLMIDKDVNHPGLYETAANLGTFYIHNGQLEDGLVHINRALEINPEAHFGREVIQQILVKYVQARKRNGMIRLPLSASNEQDGSVPDFADFLRTQNRSEIASGNEVPAGSKTEIDTADAIKGILGMMRFGNHDSPILLEALGDLLNQNWDHRLAARAYLKASYETTGQTRAAYRLLASRSLEMQLLGVNASAEHVDIYGVSNSAKLTVIEIAFQQELKEAATWYSGVVADENNWIESNIDVDEAFRVKYYSDPVIEVQSLEAKADASRSAGTIHIRTPYQAIGDYLRSPVFVLGVLVLIALALTWSGIGRNQKAADPAKPLKPKESANEP